MKRFAAALPIAIAAIAAIAGACSSRGNPGPGTPARAPTAASCATCHAPIAAEWRDSIHRVSFSDAAFQTALALEQPKDRAFCVKCHAPAAETRGTGEGVDCVTCHAAPHAREARGDGTRGCAKCHEFRFDDARAELAQKTVNEHAASASADLSCTACHMKKKEGHADHRFLAGHAPETLRHAVQITAARTRESALRVTIRTSAGHAFPTGDMFRRARLMVFAEDAHGRIVADAERVFTRSWSTGPDGARREVSDTRIEGVWEESIALDSPDATIARVRWSLLYERVVSVRGPHVGLASSDALAEGEVTW